MEWWGGCGGMWRGEVGWSIVGHVGTATAFSVIAVAAVPLNNEWRSYFTSM